MADKEYVAGDPTDVRNVAKELMSVNVLMRDGTKQAKMLHDIYKRLVDSIRNGPAEQKKLLLINLRIETSVNKIKLLEEAKLKGLLATGVATDKINKSYADVNRLLIAQEKVQGRISAAAKSAANSQKLNEALTKGLSGVFSDMGDDLKESVGTMGKFGSILFFIYDLLSKVVKIFDVLDTSAMEFRKEMGFTRKFTADIDNMARSAAVEFAKLGVTGKDAYEAVVGISTQLFSSLSVTPDLVKNISLMSAQLGVGANSTAELFRNLGMAGRSSAEAQKDTVLFATALSEAAGTPLKEVMGDISTATKSAYQFITRSSVAMVKTAVEARRMGTSIESATKTAGSLLNFTQNVKDEMEASVLLGKSMNIQKARELAYNRDIRGLNKEILNIIKETDFENLDPFQQKAVAAALGKEASELAQMAQAERERANMVKAMTPEQKKQYELYRAMEESGSRQVKNYAKIAAETLRQEGNQTRIKNIANSWHSIMMKIAEKLLPIVDVTLKFIADHFDEILALGSGLFTTFRITVPLIRAIVDDVKAMAVYTRVIVPAFTRIGTALKPIVTFFNSIITPLINFGKLIISPFVKLFGWLGRIFPSVVKLLSGLKVLLPVVGWVTKIGAFFGKWLNPIGWIITGIMFIYNLFKRLNGIGEAFKEGILHGIWFGIKAIGLAIYDTLLAPFVDAAKWIWKKLCGKSPSELGLGIVEGIKAVGGMLFNALLSPYKFAWEGIKQIGSFISDLFGNKLGSNILSGIKTVSKAIIDALLFPYKMAWELIKKIPFVSKMFGNENVGVNVTPEIKATTNAERAKPEVDVRKTADTQGNVINTMGDEFAKKIAEIVDAINSLRSDMKSGALTANVYLDSQKLDSGMGRRMLFTGTLS